MYYSQVQRSVVYFKLSERALPIFKSTNKKMALTHNRIDPRVVAVAPVKTRAAPAGESTS